MCGSSKYIKQYIYVCVYVFVWESQFYRVISINSKRDGNATCINTRVNSKHKLGCSYNTCKNIIWVHQQQKSTCYINHVRNAI